MLLDDFFSRRSEEVAKQLFEAEQRYGKLFGFEPWRWDQLDDEQKAIRILALQVCAERGMLIIN